MEGHAGRAAPDHDIAMQQWHPARTVGAFQATPEKDGGDPQGHRHDGFAQVALVAVLVQREPRARLVTVDEADIGRVSPRSLPPRAARVASSTNAGGMAGQGLPVSGSFGS